MTLQIQQLTVGPLQSNCYIVSDPHSEQVAIIDPGAEGERILQVLDQTDCTLTAIYLTHAHGDHIGALAEVKEKTGAPIYLHTAEWNWPSDPAKNLSLQYGIPIQAPAPDHALTEGDKFQLGSSEFEVWHTPGHSPGSVCFYNGEILIAGDLIFQDSVGRCDLPESHPDQLQQSLKDRILTLPENTLLYPGHGPKTTAGREQKFNPFLKFPWDFMG